MEFEYFYLKEDQIPAEQKQFYENRDGGWFLKVKGVVPRTKLDEFRNSNHELETQITTLKADLKKFEGIDPEKYTRLLSKEQELEDSKLVKAGKVDEVVEQRLAGVKADHTRQLEAKDKAIKEKDDKIVQLEGSLTKVKIDNALLAEANTRGLQKGAETFLLAAARDQWSLDDKGNPVVKDGQGRTRYGKDGDPMKPGEWMDELSVQHPFMFQPSNGSGAPAGGQGGQGSGKGSGAGGPAGGGGQGSGTDINPWKSETFNLSKQMEVFGADPAKAERMAAQAGKRINPAWYLGKPKAKAAA